MKDDREHWPRPLTIALLVLASIGLTLAAAEGLARLIWEAPVWPPPRPIPEEWADLPRFAPGPTFLYDLTRPNARGLIAGALYETNSFGFRGREWDERKPKGIFRIALIGDSWTMGWGNDERDTYASRLERALNLRRSDQTYEVLNMGMSGNGTIHSELTLMTRGLKFDPDMLIYGFTVNDLEGDHYRQIRDPAVFDLLRFRRSRIYLWRIVGPRWSSVRDRFAPVKASYIDELDENYFRTERAWNHTVASLKRMGNLSRRRRHCAVLLIHTHLHELGPLHPYHRYYAAITDVARPAGFHVIESFADFRGRHAQELWVGPFDDHPNALAHEILADVLVRGLDELPDTCWKRRSRRHLRRHD